MPPKKPNSRNWNDVQIAIATAAIATTLALWNLFAVPTKTVTAQVVDEPVIPPPPTEPPAAVDNVEPTAIPQVKIMFTQVAPQTISNPQQPQNNNQNNKKKKKNNNNNNNGGGGGGTVTNTKTS